MGTDKGNAKVVEVPANFHAIVVEEPKAKRKKFPLQGFIDFQGLQIDVENLKGSTRSGTSPDGAEWTTYMHAHYGEIRGTEGSDGDKLDVYVGENHDSGLVVVIHQHDPDTGQYDEDKVILGCESEEEAIGLYKKQYDRPGFFVEGEYTTMPMGAFWRWVKEDRNKGKRVKMTSQLAQLGNAVLANLTRQGMGGALEAKKGFAVLTAFPGSSEVPKASEWKDDWAIIVPNGGKGADDDVQQALKKTEKAAAGARVAALQRTAAIQWKRYPGSVAQIAPGLYAKSADGRFLVSVDRWRQGQTGDRSYLYLFSAVDYATPDGSKRYSTIPIDQPGGSKENSQDVKKVFAAVEKWAQNHPVPVSVEGQSSHSDRWGKGADDDVQQALKKTAKTLLITMGAAARRLKAEAFRLDRHNQSYETRMASFYAVSITQQRHTGTKKESFRVLWYTGNPAQYWNGKTVDTLKEAVALANRVKPEADRITAEEMGESPEGKLAMKRGYADGKPGAVRAAQMLLTPILVHLRAMAWSHLASHWQASGVTAYGDHLLFMRIYEQASGEVDGWAEKMVGTFGPAVVDAVQQAKWQALLLQSVAGETDPFQRALALEQQFQTRIQKATAELTEMKQLSPGWADLLGNIANAHETSIYLLQQRMAGQSPASLDGTLTKLASGVLRGIMVTAMKTKGAQSQLPGA